MDSELIKIIEQNLAVIKDFLLFQNIPPRDVVNILANFQKCEHSEGDIFFNEGEDSHSMHIVLKGTVNIINKNKRICALESPSLIGEMGLFTGMPRNATAVAAEDDTLSLRITSAELNGLLDKDPQLLSKIYRNIILCLRNKINNDNQQILSLLDEAKKNHREILELKARADGKTLPQEEIADGSGTGTVPVVERLMGNKRKFIRVIISQPSFCYAKVDDHKLNIKDISTGGVCVDLTDLPREIRAGFTEGRAVAGKIFLKYQGIFQFTGEVINLFPNLCGIEFRNMAPPFKKAIEKMVDTFQRLGQIV
ncbi:MAG: cyclic nucleotide-binding domain-containing protein [Nitrospinae bacterium]|nr:cyclic nucleotide-binding domain-containing protein [Nitrospinota bacterium]